MILNLRLQNYRSYEDKTFKFNPHTNIVVGPNAIGKTNLLEAILVSMAGKSYRSKDINLIAFNKSWARIEARDKNTTRTVKIQREKNPLKTFQINDREYKRLPFSLKLPVVLFEPNNLQILNGSPEGRRAYLDTFIEQMYQEYGPLLKKFLRALSQRNSLLKNPIRPSNNQLFPWNIRISQLGGQIVSERLSAINKINAILPIIYSKISGDKVKTSLEYISQLPLKDYETQYLKSLEATLEEDLRAGFTLLGPHRDDFVFMFDEHPSNTYASRGELRTAILSLKLSELEMYKNEIERSPVMLLDDVYSELDASRRKSLTDYLKDVQTFVTTTDADTLIDQLPKEHKLINLSKLLD